MKTADDFSDEALKDFEHVSVGSNLGASFATSATVGRDVEARAGRRKRSPYVGAKIESNFF